MADVNKSEREPVKNIEQYRECRQTKQDDQPWHLAFEDISNKFDGKRGCDLFVN